MANEIEVTKRVVRPNEGANQYMEVMKDVSSDNALFAYEMLADETIDGQKMYVMDRPSKTMPWGANGPGKAETVTQKVRVGQDDLLIHREAAPPVHRDGEGVGARHLRCAADHAVGP